MYQDCPFCNENILLSTFSESINFRAICNIAPILPGHSLVIPKKHITSLMDFSDEELNEFIVFSRSVTKQILNALNCDGFDFSIQEKEEAGQTIDHFHLHIIPRKPGDLTSPGDWYKKTLENETYLIDSSDRERLSQTEIVSMVSLLRKSSLTSLI